MKRQRAFLSRSLGLSGLPPVAVFISLLVYLAINVVLAFLMQQSPLLGLIAAVVINLIVLLFMQSRIALPFYLLVAAPSVALSLSSSGVLSRLYIGNLLFVLVVGVWILRNVLPERKAGRWFVTPSVLLPLVALTVVGLISIIYSRLLPDPRVVYSFAHSNVSITVTNIAEMTLLIGLPMFLMIASGLASSESDVRWIIIAYVSVGVLYALGTIFAGPLGLYSKQVILGYRRPQVFGEVSSGLGSILVLFSCIAFGQALYARTNGARIVWGLLTTLFAIGVIMSLGRESWIGLALAVSTIIVFRLKNWTVLLVFGGLLLACLLLALFAPNVTDFFNSQKVYGADRFKIWQDAISIWQRSPYLGVGAGNYQFFDLAYGTDVVGVAHNEYLQVLAEMGVPGLICLLWVMAAVGRRVVQRFNASKTRLGKAVAISYIGYFASIVFGGFFATSIVPSAAGAGGTAAFVGASYRWLLLGLALCIPGWEKRAEQASDQNGDSDAAAALRRKDETAPVSS